MKKFFYLILPLIAVLAIGCSRPSNPDLLEAERLINDEVGQALLILDSIPSESISGEADQALYGMLMTQAQEKNQLFPTNDSLISAAVDFFSSHNDHPRLTIATYYQGVVRQRNGRFPEALLSFLKAKELAWKEGMDFWAGMASRGMSDIYGENFNRADAVEAARDEVTYITKSGRQPYIDYALNDLASALCNSFMPEESMEVVAQVKDSALAHENPHLLHLASQVEVTDYLLQDRYENALLILESITADGFADTQDSLNYSLALVQTGNPAAAEHLLSMIQEEGNEGRKSQIRSLLSMGKGDLRGANREMQRIDSIASRQFTEGMSRQFNTIIRDYYQLQDQAAELRQERLWLTIAAMILGIIAMGGVIALLILQARRKKREKEEAILALSEQLKETTNDNNLLKKEKLELFLSQSKLFSQLDRKSRKKKSQGISDGTEEMAKALIGSLGMNQDALLRLEEEVNATSDDLIKRLRADLPKFKEVDYQLFMMLVAGMPRATIANIIDETIHNVYSRKKRIKKKIMALDPERRAPYEPYL